MNKKIEVAEASRLYEEAYAMHYTAKDLSESFCLYKRIIDAHPNTEEAKYSLSQVQNIVNAVVPKQTLFDAQVKLAIVHFEKTAKPVEMGARTEAVLEK